MPKRIADAQIKPIEEWGAKEWEVAYKRLNDKLEELKSQFKYISVYLHRAIAKIQETIN